jgi:hypothetical protein
MSVVQRIFLWLALGWGFMSVAQEQRMRYKAYFWPERIHYEVVPEAWLEEDAVMLQRTLRHRLSADDPFNSTNQMEYYYLIKLLSQRGVEQYAKIFIPVRRGTVVSHVAVRIYKPDGRVADFNGKYFKSRVLPVSTGPIEGDRYVVLDIPTAEKGDELEIYFRYEGYGLPVQIFFHDYLPILRSEYIGQRATKFEVQYKGYNGVPLPDEKTEYFELKQRWVLENLPAYRPEPGAWAVEEYPYLDFALKPSYLYLTNWKHNWTAFFSQLEQNQLQYNNRYDKRLERQLKALWAPLPPNNALVRLEAFHHYVGSRINVVPRVDGQMVNLGNDLEYGRMSQENLLLLYDDIIRRFDLDYELIFAKSKLRGPLDTALLSLDHVSHYLFRVRVDGQSYYLPVPVAGQVFPFNTVPVELQGTMSVVVGHEHKGAFSVEVLPQTSTSVSEIVRKAEIMIPMQSSDLQITEEGRYSGQYFPRLWGVMSRKYQNPAMEQRRQAVLFKLMPQLFSFDIAEVKADSSGSSFSSSYMLRYPAVVEHSDSVKFVDLAPLLYLPFDSVALESRRFAYHYPYPGHQVLEYRFLAPSGFHFSESNEGMRQEALDGIGSLQMEISGSGSEALLRLHLFVEKEKFSPAELLQFNALQAYYKQVIQKKLVLQRQ